MKTRSVRERRELTTEIVGRCAHNQFRIDFIKSTIIPVLNTKYKAEYSGIPAIIRKLQAFTRKHKIFDEHKFDLNEENKLHCDSNILKLDLIQELMNKDLVDEYYEEEPVVRPMTEEFNQKYRRLLEETQNIHDEKIN